MSLREPRNQPLTTTFNWSFLITGVMVESALTENQAFYASFRRSLIDKFYDKFYPEDDKDEDEEEEGIRISQFPIAEDYQLKYIWRPNKQNSLSVVAAGASDELEAVFNEALDDVARDPDLAGPLSYDQGFDSQGIIWDWQTDNEDKQLKTRITHTRDFLDLYYGAGQSVITRAERYLLRSDYSQYWWDGHWLTLGLGHERSSWDIDVNAKIVSCADNESDCPTINAEYIEYIDKKAVSTESVYLQDNFSVTDKHWLTIGLHCSADDYLREQRIEPRMRWEYLYADNWSSHIAAGRYSQLPELHQMLDVIGNPDLTTIKANHYVWGLEHQLDKGWSWKTDLYYKDLYDVVISISNPDDPDFDLNYSNEAEGKAYGLEFLLNKNITNKWYGWLAVSLGKTERTDLRTGETTPFNYDKPIMVDMVANYLISEHWMLGIKWSFQSGDRYTPVVDLKPNEDNPDIPEPIYGEHNSQRLPYYHQLDFRAEYTSPKDWGYWRFYVDVLNVYNRENIRDYRYSPNEKDNLSSPPRGFGENVPVRAETSEKIFPSIGFELQF